MFFMFLAQFSHAWNCHAIKATEERNGKCEKGGRHMLTLDRRPQPFGTWFKCHLEKKVFVLFKW